MKKLLIFLFLLLWVCCVNAQGAYTYNGMETQRRNKHDTTHHLFNKKGTITFVNKYPNKYYIVIDKDIYYYRNNKAVQAYDSCCNYYIDEVILSDVYNINVGINYLFYTYYKDNKLINIVLKRNNYYKRYKNIHPL